MVALTLNLCADWAYSCLPTVRTKDGKLQADENENKLIGELLQNGCYHP